MQTEEPKETSTEELEENAELETAESSESVEAEGEGKEEAKLPSPEEIEEQKERSRLGRKVRHIEDKLSEMTNAMERLLAQGQQGTATPEQKLSKAEQMLANYDPDYPISAKELAETIKALKEEIREESSNAQTHRNEVDAKYEKTYLANVKFLGTDLDEDSFDEVFKHLTAQGSPFNKRYSDDPIADSERNYYKALAALKKATSTKQENPFDKRKASSAIGVTGNSGSVVKEKALPKLDEHAKEYLNYIKREYGAEAADKALQKLR